MTGEGFPGLDKPVIEFFEQHKAQIDNFLTLALFLIGTRR